MSLPRFYIPPSDWNLDRLVLPDEEAKHALSVLRLGPGDKLVAFNGEGAEATAEIVSVEGKNDALRILTSHKTDPLPVRLVLGQAVPKGKNMDLIVQKATELGVHTIIPILSERTVVRLDAGEAAAKQAKWQRTALEACKQSGQSWLPRVEKPGSMEEILRAVAADAEHLCVVASLQPDAQHLKAILDEHLELHDGTRPTSAFALIGPEGDFTPAEYNLARNAGFQPLGLGPIILRTETAALHTLSILGHELF